MKAYRIYCGGAFIETEKKLDIINPYTQKVFSSTYLAQEKDLERAIEKALMTEKTMKELAVYKRYDILMYIAEQLNKIKEDISQILAQEAGKPVRLSMAEVKRAIQTFIVAAEECKRLPAEYLSIDWTADAKNKEAIVKYFPIGLVAGISPFNFPLNLAVHKIAPAIAAGCPIILKPASNTPLSTLILAQIIDETDLPKGAVSILPMDRDTGNKLVTDERIKLLSFTGSPDVGWAMKKNAGIKKVVLELGGNAGAIITETADIKHAAQRCITGAFAYSGQICIHLQRIFVHQSRYDEFINAFLPLINNLKTGDTLMSDTDFSVMIDEKNAKRVEAWVNESVCEGAKILYGGKRKSNFFEPTVLAYTTPQMKVNALEVFGPVVTITRYEIFEEAVDMLNYGIYGLQAGVFTNALNEMNFAFEHIDTGGIIINDIPTFRVDHMPYGGTKNSGIGREGVKYAIYDMMEAKVLVKNT